MGMSIISSRLLEFLKQSVVGKRKWDRLIYVICFYKISDFVWI